MNKILTEEQKEKYLQNTAACPFCRSRSITGVGNDYKNHELHYENYCYDCKRTWAEVYTMIRVEEVV